MLTCKNAQQAFEKMRHGYDLSEEEMRLAFPCLFAELVPLEKVQFNDYNPNKVAPPEMRLLKKSIQEDGYTQPIVVIYNPINDKYIVVDGAHRYKNAVKLKLTHVPVTIINKGIKDRIAATTRHNRARGEHNVTQMSNIVAELVLLGWDNLEISQHLGMEADEVLRLKQNTGLPEIFQSHEYSQAWE